MERATTLKRFQQGNKYFLGYKQLNTLNHPYYIHIQINRQKTFHHSVSFQHILFMKEKLQACKQNEA